MNRIATDIEHHEGRLSDRLRRNNRIFGVAVCGSVLLCSFLYGLFVGLKKPAYASLSNNSQSDDLDAGFSLTIMDEALMPDGLTIVPMGSNATLNGQPVDLLLFSTARPITLVVEEQVQKWKQRGYITSGVSYAGSAGALAHDASMQHVYVIMAWTARPDELMFLPDGHTIRGIISAQARQGEIAESAIPGVPSIPGGQIRSVFASDDKNGRSYSGIYVSPNSVEQTAEFYRMLLVNDGWVEQRSPSIASPSIISQDMERKVEQSRLVEFVNGSDHIALLLSNIEEQGAELVGNDSHTIISVTRYVN